MVVASALYRLDIYQEAYGFTRLRLLVGTFEGWLGFVVIAVMVAGISLRGSALPRVALFSGAIALAALAFANPDAWIARHNIARLEQTQIIDWNYLAGLSADAAPELAEFPEADQACLERPIRPTERDLWAWNWGYQRATNVDAATVPATAYHSCLSLTFD